MDEQRALLQRTCPRMRNEKTYRFITTASHNVCLSTHHNRAISLIKLFVPPGDAMFCAQKVATGSSTH